MEPLKPADVAKAIDLGATEEDVAEYNRLVAARFTTNPYAPKSPAQEKQTQDREERIGELYRKLFSAAPVPTEVTLEATVTPVTEADVAPEIAGGKSLRKRLRGIPRGSA